MLGSGPRLQWEPEGQLSQVTHTRLFASLLDVLQSFHLGGKRKINLLSGFLRAQGANELAIL